jgi:deoxyadenosine/deoxycytidine kinase
VSPILLVIAGPNGAGKTTVTARLRQERWSHGVEYINPDDVARDRFGDWNSPEASLQAAQWTAARREDLLSERAGIAFETVFSTHEKVDDNSVDAIEARLCVRTMDGCLRKIYGPLPEWIADSIVGLAHHPDLVDLRAG